MNSGGFKSFQDFEPVVFNKKKPIATAANLQSKSHIHIDNKNAIDKEELPKTIYYTTEQLNHIKELRALTGLNQEEASMKIGGVGKDFFNKIEANKLQFNQKTYNTIVSTLNRSLKTKKPSS
jgi:DNA-binding XRE family transcriptional regulator